MKYIVTAYDVIRRTTLNNSTSPQAVCNFLSCELEALEECFGDHYEKMLEDIVLIKDLKEWCHGEPYEEGAKVLFMGKAFERNGEPEEQEDSSPYCSEIWTPCPKFKSECYNLIYECLVDYLAWFIFGEAAPYLQIQASDGGFIFPNSDQNGGTGADKDWFYLIRRTITSTCAKKLKRLKRKIEAICDRGQCQIFLQLPMFENCGSECDTESKTGSTTLFKDKGRRRR